MITFCCSRNTQCFVFSVPVTLEMYSLFLVVCLCACAFSDNVTPLNADQLHAFSNCNEVINVANSLLDQLSETNVTAQVDSILNQLGALFTDDIVVITDGSTYSGKATVLEGQRIIHGRLEHHARRVGSSQILEEFTHDQVTIYQLQVHYFTAAADGSFNTYVRDTRGTCVKQHPDTWLVSRNVLFTVYKNGVYANGVGGF